jgi:alkanesulfonate monooxygenase
VSPSRRGAGIALYSTCPPSSGVNAAEYLTRVEEVARWSEDAECRGILVYSDNGLVDPWLVSGVIAGCTSRLSPLVAVQPVYMHPYACAKMVSSIAYLHGRKVHLNMVAGGFRGDLLALDDATPHDDRYDRLIEFTLIVKRLLASSNPVTFEGRYYTVRNLKMTPALPEGLQPGVFVSGSSPRGIESARVLRATAVKYPRPPGEEEDLTDGDPDAGVRIGVIARDSEDDAWREANERFPGDRRGQITHQVAMKISDSHWHGQLARLGAAASEGGTTYWLWPFENYNSFCPYLVGSYSRVAGELARYIDAGYRTFILDVPPSREELAHVGEAFSRAVALGAR